VHIAFLKGDMSNVAYSEFKRIKTFFEENA